jgi:hypothetical protein
LLGRHEGNPNRSIDDEAIFTGVCLLIAARPGATLPTSFNSSRITRLELSTGCLTAFGRDLALDNGDFTLARYPGSSKDSWETYLLVRVHVVEPTLVAGLSALPSDILDLFVRAVGEVAGVGVLGRHDEWMWSWSGFRL